MIIPIRIVGVFGLLAVIQVAAYSAVHAAEARPNVMVIVADDLGYADVGFQGSKEIKTPHLDSIAQSGIRCSNGYVSHPFCSPTRAGLLTGRYQHRFGHENNPVWDPTSLNEGLPLDQITLPTLLSQKGYSTGAVGKWHLGAHPQFHPLKRGFAEYFGALGGGHQYFPPNAIPSAKSSVEYSIPLDRNGVPEAHTKYLTEHFGDEAAAFVQRHAGEDRPWFLYLAFNAPHTPLQAPDPWLKEYAAIADDSRRNYAAMISALDAAVGQVLHVLDASAQRENTLLFFVSDNGGPNLSGRNLGNFTSNAPLRGAKGQLYEGGVRVPFVVSWPKRLKPGVYDQPVIALDILPTALSVAGGTLPQDRVIDGVDLLPYLTGERRDAPHEALHWRSGGPNGNHSVRQGPWKLVQVGAASPELFNLDTDVGESTDLADRYPEKVHELTARIKAWEQSMIAPVFSGPPARRPVPQRLGTIQLPESRPATSFHCRIELPQSAPEDQPLWIQIEGVNEAAERDIIRIQRGDRPSEAWCLIPEDLPRSAKLSLMSGRSNHPPLNAQVSVKSSNEAIEVQYRGRRLLRYNVAHREPPEGIDRLHGRSGHIHPVQTYSGHVVTDEFPPDHAHQSGIFLSYPKTTVDGRSVDFWNLGGGQGRVRHEEVIQASGGPVFGQWTVSHAFVEQTASAGSEKGNGDQKIVADSIRTHGEVAATEVWRAKVWPLSIADRVWCLDIESETRATPGRRFVLPPYHYGGMALRGAREWKPDRVRILTSDGDAREAANEKRVRWCDMSGEVDGKPVGIALISHSKNFRYPEPIRVHPTMPYFVYTPSQLGEWTIPEDPPHTTRYRFVVHDGPTNPHLIDQLAAAFSEPIEGTFQP